VLDGGNVGGALAVAGFLESALRIHHHQDECGEDADDRNHGHEFDEGEAGARSAVGELRFEN